MKIAVFILLYISLVALLAVFGKKAQKIFIEGVERARAINEMKSLINYRRKAHERLR